MAKYTVRIDHCDAVENPCEHDGSWKFYSFSRNHYNYKNPAEIFHDSGKPRLKYANKLRHGLAFVLSYYQHGGCLWSIRGSGPQCRWDTVQRAGIAVWEEPVENMGAKSPEDREKDCRNCLKEYNSWANGECYWFEIIDSEGNQLDSCGGFIGEYVLEGVRESLPKDATEENTEIVSQYGFETWQLYKSPLPQGLQVTSVKA